MPGANRSMMGHADAQGYLNLADVIGGKVRPYRGRLAPFGGEL